MQNPPSKHKTTIHRSYKNFDKDSFLGDIRKSDILSGKDPPEKMKRSLTDQWHLWKEAFLVICNKHAPLKHCRVKDRLLPWMSSDVIEMIHKRDFLKRVAVRSKSCQDLLNYRKLRNKITYSIRKKKQNYFDEIAKNHINNPKVLWDELHKVTGISKSVNTLPNDITADEMNDYFINISKTIANSFERKSPVWHNPPSLYKFSFEEIELEHVCRQLNNLTENSKLDVLTFDTKLLYMASELISESLTQMFNTSLRTGEVPTDWLLSKITPVYKGKGDKSVKLNYRPIAVVCHIAKIIEKVVNSQFLSYLLNHNFITIDQHAFLLNHSTNTCIHQVADDWFEAFNEHEMVAPCFLDISSVLTVSTTNSFYSN